MSGHSIHLARINEGNLCKALNVIFPEQQIQTNVKKAELKYASTGATMELDIWMPNYNLGFEFQDSYHYVTTWYNQSTFDHIQQKDYIKKQTVRQKGISLIVVPCWWNGDVASLMSSIWAQRPDLVPESACYISPISLNPPLGFFTSSELPYIGELMLASLNHEFVGPPEIWWMGEKYDGVRCCWSSAQRKLYSRYGKVLDVPINLQVQLPTTFFDGEIWFGRQQYAQTYSIVMGIPNNLWCYLRLIAFDIPTVNLQHIPFEKRYEELLDNVDAELSFLAVVFRVLCEHQKHLEVFMSCIISDGGEGTIMRKHGSLYEHGRSPNLIKLKTANDDMEGIVEEVSKRDSLLLKLPSGGVIEIPRENVHIPLPAVGEIVSISYESVDAENKPTNPYVFRVRHDMTWDDVLQVHFSEKRESCKNSMTK